METKKRIKEETAKSKKTIITLHLYITAFAVICGFIILAIIEHFSDYGTLKSGGYVWVFYFGLISYCILLGCSLSITCCLTNCLGYYRCKACGHIHRPNDETAIEAAVSMKFGMLHCPNCDAATRHKKLRPKDYPKTDAECEKIV